jgi:hypothetical protein
MQYHTFVNSQLLQSPFDVQIFQADETSTPSVDIVAVHDLGETATDAWTDEITTALAKSSKETPERGKNAATGNIAQTTMMSPPPFPAPASMVILDSKGRNTDSKKLVESGLKSPAMFECDASLAKLLRKARKDTASQMRSTEGSVQSSLELERTPPKEVNWIRDLLSHDIPRSRILAFGYREPDTDKKPFTWTEYVDRMAKGLLSHIQRARTDLSESRVPFVFIGYGFGGVIIQRAVELVLSGWRVPMAGEDPTAVEPPDQTKHAVPEKPSSTANDTTETKDKAPIRAHDIYQILLLDTPFPDYEDELFPANTNVRMCSIIEDIEDGEKDSGILNDVWDGFIKANYQALGGKAIDVTWLHSQAKGRQTDGHAPELVNVSTMRDR